MRKKVLVILSLSIITALTAVGVFYFMEPSEEDLLEAEKAIQVTFTSEINDDEYSNLFTKDMSEHKIQQIIHSMSHQKVKAKQKWGKVVITQERISFLIEVTENNKDTWEHSDLYLNILNRWYEGDFSKADKDHNTIWELQGGNIGKATGLLNAVEEQKYLEEEE